MSPTKCRRCKRPHTTRTGAQACTGHISSGPRKGQPCANPPLHGADVCRYHGGAAGQVRAAAATRAQEAAAARELARLGRPVEIHPSDALLDLVHWTAGEVQFWRQRVVDLADRDEAALTWGKKSSVRKTSGQWPGKDTTSAAAPHVAYVMLTDASNRLAGYCAAALKAGVEERRVRLAEQQGDLVAEAIRRILDALNLTPEQQTLVSKVVPAQLRLIAGGTP